MNGTFSPAVYKTYSLGVFCCSCIFKWGSLGAGSANSHVRGREPSQMEAVRVCEGEGGKSETKGAQALM